MNIVLFSGGVDSTLVAYLLRLRGVKFLAVTVDAEYVPRREVEFAKRIAKLVGFKHEIVRVNPTPEFLKNDSLRCYHCKRNMLKTILERFGNVKIFDGTNKDDLKDCRPGLKANEEFGVISPLKDFGKEEVRVMARLLGLPNWNKPPNSCLATRIVGEITPEKLKMVEKAEDFLHDLGFEVVRVRHEFGNARVEVGRDEIVRAFEVRDEILKKLKEIGFRRVSLDLEGY